MHHALPEFVLLLRNIQYMYLLVFVTGELLVSGQGLYESYTVANALVVWNCNLGDPVW